MERLKKAGENADTMRAAILSGNLEFYRTNAELESKLITLIESELETEKVIQKSEGITEVKTKASRRDVIKVVELIWKKRGVTLPEKNAQSSEMPQVNLVVANEETKDIIERIKNLP